MVKGRLDGILATVQALIDAGGERPLDALSPGELVTLGEVFGSLKRHVDAAFTPVAAEIARQSRTELGKESLARKQGFRTPEAMISAATGVPVGEAKRIVQVGEATAPRASLTGTPLPEKHPHVAAALRAGRIGVTASAAIVAMLDRVGPRADPGLVAEAEETLAEAAEGLRPDELARLLVRAEAHLDPHGAELRQAEIRADRALTISEHDGVLRLEFRSDVASGAPVKVAIEGMVSAMLAQRRASDGEDASGVDAGVSTVVGGAGQVDAEEPASRSGEADQRSIRQMRADALIELCRHGIGCDQMPHRPTATVVVRMDLEALRTGIGQASIDGIDHPVAAGAVRRLAADLQVIPLVLGGQSEILDLGRTVRLFTPAQKHALIERDGGCVGCGAPPGRCHVHHLTWWSHGGATDLANGVLLCSACHHRLHDDGWEIRIDGPGTRAEVWMIPPPWIDPDRTPRRARRHRYDLIA